MQQPEQEQQHDAMLLLFVGALKLQLLLFCCFVVAALQLLSLLLFCSCCFGLVVVGVVL